MLQRTLNTLGVIVITATAPGLASVANGQCRAIDFDGFADGTVITAVSGVTFSAQPDSCGGVQPVIVTPPSTSSGTRALSVMTGCPDFSPDYLRMVFADPQAYVTMTVGDAFGTALNLEIRVYSTTSGGAGLLSTQAVTAGSGVNLLIAAGAPGGPIDIRRIEVESTVGLFEAIDTISFDYDDTPPTVRIDSPSFNTCVCGLVSVTGISCDTDGAYGSDRLEYRRVNDPPGTPWSLVGSFATPLFAPGTLYVWDTSSLTHGQYYIRLTTENACGSADTDISVVRVDKQAPGVTISSPTEAETVCGVVEIRGGVSDSCSANWTLDLAPAAGGAATTIASGSTGVNCTLLPAWDTTIVADGLYTLTLSATDGCGNAAELNRLVDIDNSGPCDPCPADVNEDGAVDVADLLFVLGAWGNCLP